MAHIDSGSHSAESAALGFYYQSLYALLSVLKESHDDAAVCLERLDDVEVISNGQPLLIQLKHSIVEKPVAVSLASKALWKTLKAWIDVLPKLAIEDTRFQLVTVAPLSAKGFLGSLLDESASRESLHSTLLDEAQRVVDEHQAGRLAGLQPLPHTDRVSSCAAFLKLDNSTRKTLLSRITVRPGGSNITGVSDDIAGCLVNFPPDSRQAICIRLIEWWDLQVIFTLCGKRERFITKLEVQQKISELAGEIERDELFPDFENALMPEEHVPDSMIARQIQLVGGTRTEVRSAEREEWRARSQRHKWATDRLDMAVRIDLYDGLLQEAWQDKHGVMSEECEQADDIKKRGSGLELLRWTFNSAHKEVRPFAPNWSGTYYVRGSYQVMAINQLVGWHPEFKKLLGSDT